MINRTLANTAAEFKVDTRERSFIQLTSKLPLHNWMEDRTLICSPTSNYLLTSDLYNVIYKFSWQQRPCKVFWNCYHKTHVNKHNYITLVIILYATETTKKSFKLH